jgi:hypothetical protein
MIGPQEIICEVPGIKQVVKVNSFNTYLHSNSLTFQTVASFVMIDLWPTLIPIFVA